MKAELIGKSFGRLTVLKVAFRNEKRRSYHWKCQCQCGGTTITSSTSLITGQAKSCGCLQRDIARISFLERFTTHNMSKTRFYKIWQGIKKRCINPNNHAYAHYGGRGIKNFWNSFEEFRNDMYESYIKHVQEFGEKNTSIDRINVNGNYEKSNCRWATYKEQANNTRVRKLLNPK